MAGKKKKISQQKKSSKGIVSKNIERDLGLLLIPVILLVVLQILSIYLNTINSRTSAITLASQSFGAPVTDYAFFNHPISPPISAEAAIIIDRDSKTVLYEKNAHLRFSMASTTKIMTALVALDHFKPDDILTTITSHVEGVNVGVEVGDRLYFKDALYAMLLPSGNDIAYLIAQNYPGGEDAFISAMNKKAKSLHLQNTHYADPAGLNDDGNYTTASELSQLAAIVSKNSTLADITATKSKIIQTVDGTKVFTLTNLNQLLGQYGVIGMKTGHTEGAGDVLITSAIDSGHTYIIVVMRSQNRFADTEILLSSLISSVTTFSPRSFAD
jgi:D-alanyl-D-alanine carboxypeptidase (penicillin-binding protein 5/6)